MKLIKTIIHHIVIPLATAFFIIVVGLCAAGISALIEFCVLREMFSSEYQKLISATTIALMLVVILEFTKIYLHFLLNKLKEDTKLQCRIKWILYFLVLISTICTIIFCVSTFHLASYNAEKTELEISNINEQLVLDIADAKSYRLQEYNSALQPYIDAKTNANIALQEFNPEGLNYQERISKLEALKLAVQTANEEYNNMQPVLAELRDNFIESDVNKLETVATEKINKISDFESPETAAQYDNPILAQFLTVLAQILFNTNTYSRIVYLVVTVLFSILIAVLLECIISVCFNFISYPLDTLVDTTTSITPTLQTWCNKLILTALKTFCALFISILIITATPTPMDKFQFMIAALSCMLAIMLVQHYISGKTDATESRGQLLFAVRDAILEGILSFMGYVLLGFFLGKDALTLDVSTFAIGIGTTISSIFGYVPAHLNSKFNSITS